MLILSDLCQQHVDVKLFNFSTVSKDKLSVLTNTVTTTSCRQSIIFFSPDKIIQESTLKNAVRYRSVQVRIIELQWTETLKHSLETSTTLDLHESHSRNRKNVAAWAKVDLCVRLTSLNVHRRHLNGQTSACQSLIKRSPSSRD